MLILNLLYYSYLSDQRHKLLLEFKAGVSTCTLSWYFGFRESNPKTTMNVALRFPVTKTAKDQNFPHPKPYLTSGCYNEKSIYVLLTWKIL